MSEQDKETQEEVKEVLEQIKEVLEQSEDKNDWILDTYDKYMLLKVFVSNIKDNDELKQKYIEHAKKHNESLQTNISYFDAGFDLFTPGTDDEDEIKMFGPNVIRCFATGWEDTSPVNKLDFKVKCSAQIFTDTGKTYNTGYYMYPRSSLSKTNLRLANSVGIIDAGYRGHLMGMFDVVNINENDLSEDRDYDYIVKKYDRLVQICAPGLMPIVVEIVDSVDDLGEKTVRGDNGFGSTGK